MKKFKIVLAIMVILILQAGCATSRSTSRGDRPEVIRRSFIGTWQGEHMDHENNLFRTWIQHRVEDGTYIIIFLEVSPKGISKSREKGKWWIEGDRFYEICPDLMEKPDVYQFEILNESQIRFRSTVKDYEFIDKRM